MKNNIVVHTGSAGSELYHNSLKEVYEKSSYKYTPGVWMPTGSEWGSEVIYASTTPRVVSEKEMMDSIKSSFYTSRSNKEKLKKYFKNIDHSEENRIYVDNMFKTILDKDLFKILLEDFLVNKNLIGKAYKKIDTRRRGPGLMEFLEDGNMHTYTPRELCMKDIEKIWYSFPSI